MTTATSFSVCAVGTSPLSQIRAPRLLAGNRQRLANLRLSSRLGVATVYISIVLLAVLPAAAGDAALAPMPPMGWNSWDSYGRTITEAQVKANALWMAKHLKRFGWQYVVVDEGWYIPNPEGQPQDYKFLLSTDGRFIPAPGRFPSAENDAGFRPL